MADITGTDNADTLDGTSGSDTIYGLDGDDVLNGGDAIDFLYGGPGNDILDANPNWQIFDWGEVLDGGPGADIMYGGQRSTYYVDDLGDIIIAPDSGGYAYVYVSVDGYHLAENVGYLYLTGSEDYTVYGTDDRYSAFERLYGNSGNNTIYGLAGSDIIDGGEGNDTLIGGEGYDEYYVDSPGDTVVEGPLNLPYEGGYRDTVYATVTYTLPAYVENLTLQGDQNLEGTGNDLDNWITGNSGNNILLGLDGNDFIKGGPGADYLEGGQGDNFLLGEEGDDSLVGGDGIDRLYGGTGIDVMEGGPGDDEYQVDNADDVIIEAIEGGNDTVRAEIAYILPDNFENLIMANGQDGTGNGGNNRITGDFSGTLLGLGGDDYLDTYFGGVTMIGGPGNDTYDLDSVYSANMHNTVLVESPDEGVDLIILGGFANYVIPDNFENLTVTYYLGTQGNFTGNADDNIIMAGHQKAILNGLAGDDALIGGISNDALYGGEGDDSLTGGDGFDFLDGGEGVDALSGGKGNDYYVIDAYDILAPEEAGYTNGKDTIELGFGDYALPVNYENLVLTGTASINGTGNEGDNRLTGNSGDNILLGLSGSDVLLGGEGDDVLDGGAWGDVLQGGPGDDIYYCLGDSINDTIIENSGEGIDTLFVEGSKSLMGTELENLIITPSVLGTDVSATGNQYDNYLQTAGGNDLLQGGLGDDSLHGGSGNDVIYGENGNDLLDGGGGADFMDGSTGDDTYIVDHIGDVVADIDYSAVDDRPINAGIDTVISSVSYSLPFGAVTYQGESHLSAVENLVLVGAENINGTGNELGNILIGNDGANILTAGAGKDKAVDVLNGGLGADTLYGGKSAGDIFVFDSILGAGNVDRLADFKNDKIVLDVDIFTSLQVGALPSDQFVYIKKGAVAAVDANDHILYSKAAGTLYYDADGNGAGEAVAFASFSGKLSAGSISVIDWDGI